MKTFRNPITLSALFATVACAGILLMGCQPAEATAANSTTEPVKTFSSSTNTTESNAPATNSTESSASSSNDGSGMSASEINAKANAQPSSGPLSDKVVPPKAGEDVAVLTTKFGEVVFKFRKDLAPKTVEAFIKLAKKNFYDGTTFHRVIPGFMIQGGDPNTKPGANSGPAGTGGPGYNLKAEFNKLHHGPGVVSMARSQDPDSAGSQFFICVADADSLDGQYTAFGQVLSGQEVADKIVAEPRDGQDMPNDRIEMKVKIVKWPYKKH